MNPKKINMGHYKDLYMEQFESNDCDHDYRSCDHFIGEEIESDEQDQHISSPEEQGEARDDKKEDENVISNLEPKRTFVSLAEALELIKDMPEQVFLIPGVKENTIGFIFGPPKSGKTAYVETLFLHIAGGRKEFLGYPLNYSSQKCLFISLEEGGKVYRYERNGKQLSTFKDDPERYLAARKNYMLSDASMPPNIINEEHWNILDQAIADSGASYVCIDSLNRLTSESNADEKIAKKIMMKLQRLVKRHGITLFVINHTTKSSNEGIQTGSSMSGSRIYGSEADFVIDVNRTATNGRYIKLAWSRHGNDILDTVDKFEITENRVVRIIGKASEYSLIREQDGRYDDTNLNLVLDEIQSICARKNCNEIDIADLKHLFEGANTKFTKQTFYDILKRDDVKCKFRNIGRGKYRLIE
jgi:KaiC/GvpD/RAD55 family RecA-like ATPase